MLPRCISIGPGVLSGPNVLDQFESMLVSVFSYPIDLALDCASEAVDGQDTSCGSEVAGGDLGLVTNSVDRDRRA